MSSQIVAGIFPGQGSQAVGMGKDLYESSPVVRDIFDAADSALGFSLSSVCFEGPVEELKRTSIAQPALVTMSYAYNQLMVAAGLQIGVAGGHSLGEYSALTAIGAIDFITAVKLVRKRGELMEIAAANNPGGMAAVIGSEDEVVAGLCAEIAAQYGSLAPANYNSPGQVVISGVNEAIAAFRTEAKARGMRVIPLQVSGAFHSPLMQSAADAFAVELNAVIINIPTVPIVQNVTAMATTDPIVIKKNLAAQITGSVKWTASLNLMRSMGTMKFVEIGPGNVLTGLVGRTFNDIEAVATADYLK
jgi:[acyl-carrier-protein] S-malonyltransferase